MLLNQSIISDIKSIIAQSKDKAIRAVDHQRTLMYWHIDKCIFEEEQDGKDRADYGKYLTEYSANELEPEFGNGFSKRQIELFRQFYRVFPIVNALRSQLSWTQYKLLLSIDSEGEKMTNNRLLKRIKGVLKMVIGESTKSYHKVGR